MSYAPAAARPTEMPGPGRENAGDGHLVPAAGQREELAGGGCRRARLPRHLDAGGARAPAPPCASREAARGTRRGRAALHTGRGITRHDRDRPEARRAPAPHHVHGARDHPHRGALRAAAYGRIGLVDAEERVASPRALRPSPPASPARSRSTQRFPSFTQTWNGRSTSANTCRSVISGKAPVVCPSHSSEPRARDQSEASGTWCRTETKAAPRASKCP